MYMRSLASLNASPPAAAWAKKRSSAQGLDGTSSGTLVVLSSGKDIVSHNALGRGLVQAYSLLGVTCQPYIPTVGGWGVFAWVFIGPPPTSGCNAMDVTRFILIVGGWGVTVGGRYIGGRYIPTLHPKCGWVAGICLGICRSPTHQRM